MTQEVLYFNDNGCDFGVSLGRYLKEHPRKQVVCIAPQQFNGYTTSNVVVVTERGLI